MQQATHILSNTWLTRGLSVDEAEQLLLHCTLRVLQPGEQLFAAGAPSHELWFVRTGSLELSADGVKPARPVRARAPATLCDLSLLAPGPHSVTATAVEPVRLYGLSHDSFLRLRHTAPSAAAKLLRALAPALAARLRECNDRAESATVERQLDLAAPAPLGGGHLQAMADQLLAEGSRAPSTTRVPGQTQELRASERGRPAAPSPAPSPAPATEPERPGMFGRFKQALGGKTDPKGKP